MFGFPRLPACPQCAAVWFYLNDDCLSRAHDVER